MQIKLKPISAKKKNFKLLRKGQWKKRKEKAPSNGKKNHLGFDKLNDIMLLHNIYSCSAFSEENKAAFTPKYREIKTFPVNI